MIKLALLLGGPSEERGISLNSARSVADHLTGDQVSLAEVVFFDRQLRPYSISPALLYSNTPSDFDFRLAHEGRPLSDDDLIERLRRADLAFSVIHGSFGEDGTVQRLLERAGVPFVGSSAAACERAFDKYSAGEVLHQAGVSTVPSLLATSEMTSDETGRLIDDAFPDAPRLVLKPARGGSSIDVHAIADRAEAKQVLRELLTRYERIVVQPWMTGAEVTTIVLDASPEPIALVPVQIQLNNRVDDDEIFDYRRKYLASNDVHYYCPPRQPSDVTNSVRKTSETAFKALGLRDFARIDGWLQPDGRLIVSDVNIISGLEQNSFLFIQAAQVGMTHRDILWFVLRLVATRSGLAGDATAVENTGDTPRRPVAVLFGGSTAERQVSVTSGTNVWLKLLRSERYAPVPYLLDPDGSVWRLSYASALRHSVEEIVEACLDEQRVDAAQRQLIEAITRQLGVSKPQADAASEQSHHMSFDQFLDEVDLVFLALHGGAGENGTVQRILDAHNVRYNGSGPEASALCMDKAETGRVVAALNDPGIQTARRTVWPVPPVNEHVDVVDLWQRIQDECGSAKVIVKPLDDGCSAGVVPLAGVDDLTVYLAAINQHAPRVNGELFSLLVRGQLIEMPAHRPKRLLFERYIETDDIRVEVVGTDVETRQSRLIWGEKSDTGWIEVTVGVLGVQGAVTAMNPSLTIAATGVLSLEEKFMGGTGINITPPPSEPLGRVSPQAVGIVKTRIATVANALGVAGYARIDAFMHRDSGDIIVIEANSLPGLTPATVFYHQGLAEEPPMAPRQLLEKILDLALAEDGRPAEVTVR